MKRQRSVLLVLVLLLSGCGGRTFDSIKKMTPVAVLVGLVALTSLGHDRRLKQLPTR